MQIGNSSDRYGVVPQFLHWLTVILVLAAWMLGMFGDDLPRGQARAIGLFLHITAGLLVLAIVIARIVWRGVDAPPPPEVNPFGRWAERASVAVHYVLYALLVAVPVVGIVTQFARGNALPILGIWEIASPWVRDRQFARTVTEVHEVLANTLVILAALHAGAALIHHWVFRDETLRRMLPQGWR